MLRRLSIRNIVLIEALDLEFGPGLNAFTGETGAGKSILLDALGLALGARGGAGLVRQGAPHGVAAASFDLIPGSRVQMLLTALAFPSEGEEVILRRTISEDGRGKAFVNDQPASVGALRDIGAALVEIHGQHDERGVLDVAEHRAALDAFAGLTEDARRVKTLGETARASADAALERAAQIDRAGRDRDFLAHAAAEVDALKPQPGEATRLDADRRLMRRAARIVDDVRQAQEAVGPETGAEGALAIALRRLQVASADAEGALDPALAAVDRAIVEVCEAARLLDEVSDRLIVDPARLEAVEERLFALRALARKHQCDDEALPALAEDLRAQLAAIEAGDDGLQALRRAAEDAAAAFEAAAEILHADRTRAAADLDAAVTGELPPLRMERARFVTDVSRLEAAGPDGVSRVEFTVATNPGAPPGPIVKIASGGELSRFLLALKLSLSRAGHVRLRRSDAPTLIFDEIDRGVGGATADAVGARLRRLAHADVTPPDAGSAGQVLVVTHSPQVAAQADRQWRIEKRLQRDGAGVERAWTDVLPLDLDGRIEEIARMISGEVVTVAARVTAKTLIEAAQTEAGDRPSTPGSSDRRAAV